MEKSELVDIIRSFDSELDINEGKQFTEVIVPASKLFSLSKNLKENSQTCFDFLFCITGVDYGNDLGVIYHMRSTKHGQTIVLKVRIADRNNPEVDSVTSLWKTADFHEREVYDLLGIRFANHPDLRRLFLDNSWGYPLRKDYVDDINIVSK